MTDATVVARASHRKVKRFTRRHLYRARRLRLEEAKLADKAQRRFEKSQGRRDSEKLAAFNGYREKDGTVHPGVPPESTLALIGEEF